MKYTDKVIDHFQNPRNVGEMDNPDAEGQVGNPACLLPSEIIQFDDFFEEISKSKKGRKVLSHDGHFNEIKEVFTRNFNGEIIKLKNKLGKVSLTPEHLVFAIKLPDENKYFRTRHKRELFPAWYHAKDLKRRDLILFPLFKEEKDVKLIKHDIKKLKFDFKSKPIPAKILLNSDFLRLCGYFLSEGYISLKKTRTYLSFTLNIKENNIAEDIKNISKRLFGLEIKIKERPERNTLVVFIYNATLARFFNNLFNKGAANKKIPQFMMELPKNKQKHLIKGLWAGDGYVNLKREGQRAGYCTISSHLAEQLKTLLLRQKIIPSIYVDKEKIKNGVNHKKSYRIHIGERESLTRLSKILGIKYQPKTRGKVNTWIDDNYLYIPITSTKKEKYKGIVYNLEVQNSHSFVSSAFCLHNCGDVMKIQIRVEDNIIKDIKFQTMGCAAAIATSSMITEMAIGKTLEDAEKITRDDVAHALGDLPPIKMHCSNLAADALRKAIDNYRNAHKK